jgi:hypothetical protein
MVIKSLIDALYVIKETVKLTRFVVFSPFGIVAGALFGLQYTNEF